MNSEALIVRRAVVDDIPQLIELWKSEKLPWQELEKRFTEFQVVVDSQNQVLGAIGLHISGQEALLHSEVFSRFDLADTIREMIWKRFESIAHNYGLFRIWTLENSPYWHHNGFVIASTEQMQKLPRSFGNPGAIWYVMSFRQEGPVKVLAPEKELEILLAQERAETEKISNLAKVMRIFATILAAILLIGIIIAAVYVMRKLPMIK
ncbi:MAG: hypothetical protein ACP5MG_03380 [Verrucomicrobiia bacterium]|jgi:N-acetylglutamate synthase-like GNAT family acetyltransferase